jgi:dTDP-glucose pyrophosphorylase
VLGTPYHCANVSTPKPYGVTEDDDASFKINLVEELPKTPLSGGPRILVFIIAFH